VPPIEAPDDEEPAGAEPQPPVRPRAWLSITWRRALLAVEILVILVVLVTLAGIWIGIHALDARDSLEATRLDVTRLRADLVSGQDATADLRRTQRDARAADRDTHDPIWFLGSWLAPIRTTRGLSSVADQLARNALPPLVQVAPSIEPAKLRVGKDTLALQPLAAAAPAITRAAVATAAARQRVGALPTGWVGLVNSARSKTLDQLTSLSGSIDDAARFARVGPSMLGADGTRRYFVAIQNNAQARATGGLVAAYAILTADHGTIRVVQRGNDSELRDASHPVVDLGPAFDSVYGYAEPAQKWSTSNGSPNFPDAADIWAHLWEAQSGEHIDGAIAVDPPGLASVLNVTGPATVPGYPGTFTGADLTSFIEQGEYQQFQGAQASLRKPFVSKVAGAVLDRLLSGAGSPAALATALGQSAGAGHLQIWSSHPGEEAGLQGTPLAGELPRTIAPFAAVAVNNATGSKLDYYLDRSLTYNAGSCSGPSRRSTITVGLLDTAPLHGLPAYVRIREDGGPFRYESVPRERLLVSVYGSDGAQLYGTTLNGRSIDMVPGSEQGHPLFQYDVTLDPGVRSTLTLHLLEPVPRGSAQTKVQPMARGQQTSLDVPVC
jgi:hypothetical protein